MTKNQLNELKEYVKELVNDEQVDKAVVNPTKKKMEFSKKWLISTSIVAVFFTAVSYVLSYFDKNPVENLSIEIIRMLWGVDGVSFIGYNIQNSIRAWSLNKAMNPEISYKDEEGGV